MIEFEIVNKNITPPEGWYYKQPESGRVFKHYSYQPFMDAIREHRIGNGYPMSADWQEEIIDDLCRSRTGWFPHFCKRRAPGFHIRRFSFGAVMSFLKMLWDWVAAGHQFVDQSEADRRAAICLTCPYNQPLAHGCGACFSKILGWIAKIVGDRKTKHDAALGSCGICSCALKASVWFPIEAQQANLTEEIKDDFKRTEWCWKGQGL